MGVPLVVILGAGASRGSADYGTDLRPPLTVDLFEEELYGEYLRSYDLAHQAGRHIAEERKNDDALGLEQALHSLRTSEFGHRRQMALAVPPYLQALLLAVSERHYSEAFRYDRLIDRLLKLEFVCFVTLNYDVLLDRRLNAHHRLETFDDYISSDENWWLIKPHGSVNWWHPSMQFDPAAPQKGLQWDGEVYRCELPTAPLEAIRGYSQETDRYPALAMPEGPEDRLVLPGKHVEYARERLRDAHQIDILMIGYSGLDTSVLDLLTSTEPDIRHVTIVDRDLGSGMAVRERLRTAGFTWVWEYVAPSGFRDWVAAGGIDTLVAEYEGPYSNSNPGLP